MKLCLFLSLCACLVYVGTTTDYTPRLEVLGTGEYCIYSTQQVESPLITKRLDTGFSYIYYCDSTDAPSLRSLFKTIDGESITIKSTSADKILRKLNFNAVSISNISSVNIIYAYSARVNAFIRDGNKKINLQIATNAQTTTVGWPVILGSY